MPEISISCGFLQDLFDSYSTRSAVVCNLTEIVKLWAWINQCFFWYDLQVYVIWSILSIVFCILIVVTAFITVALTYFQLAVEDHRWWWRSFLCGGSTGLFIFGYCFYYYHHRSSMSGLMQTSFFFGYMGVVCYAVFLMLGSIGFRASLMFVQHIYK